MISLTRNYVALPRKLITELRDNPLAIALYFLIARLYLIHQAPIPLSRGDIRRLDPSLKIGAVRRALERLLEAGWLIETPGYKSSYTPTWGRSRSGTLFLWAIPSDLLGCPKNIWSDAIRIDRALLDLFVGKLTPSKRLAATVSGFFADPDGRHVGLLALPEVGSYILAVAGHPTADTAALQRWGLFDNGEAQPVPASDVVLALASQRASLTTFQLTKAAWHLLGFGYDPPPQSEVTVESRPLLCVPKERIGQRPGRWTSDWIGQPSLGNVPRSASAGAKHPQAQNSPNRTGNLRDSSNARDTTTEVGGSILVDLPETETAKALRAFGVFSSKSLADLAGLPVEQVGGAIAYAQANQLGPGWVVQALRRCQMGEALPTLHRPGQQGIVDWKAEQAKYGDLFRSDDGLAALPVTQERRDTWKAEQQKYGDLFRTSNDLSGLSLGGHNEKSADLSQQVREQLRMRHSRQHHRLINALTVTTSRETTTMTCASLADRMTVLAMLQPALRAIVKELGLPEAIQVMEVQGTAYV